MSARQHGGYASGWFVLRTVLAFVVVGLNLDLVWAQLGFRED